MGRYLFPAKDPKTAFHLNRDFGMNLTLPEYHSIDPTALDLLRQMLAIDASSRLGAAECLEHPFLRECSGEKVEVSPASTSEDYHF
jgi:serine/threonine protein kinase